MALGDLFITVGAKIDGFKAAMGDVNDALDAASRQADKATRGWSDMFSSLQSVGVGMTAAVTAPLVGVGAAAVSVAEHLNMARLGFETMLGSAQAAGTFLADLKAFAASTPFEFPELVDASKRMMAMGFAAKDVVPTLRTIGDATAALGGNAQMIDRITLALGQMSAKGKVSAQEMNQLAENGIPAWQMLADKIGVSIPEAMKQAEKGAIAASVAIPAILDGMNEKFGGSMQKASQTLTGVWSNFKDQLTFALGDIGTTLTPVLTQIINDFGIPMLNMLRDLTASFAALDPETQKIILGVAALAAAVGPVLLAIGTLGQAIIGVQAAVAVLGPAIGAMGGVFAAITGPIGLTVIAIAALGYAAYEVYQNWETVKGHLINTWDIIAGKATEVTKANNLMVKGMYDLTAAEKAVNEEAERVGDKLTKKAEATKTYAAAAVDSKKATEEYAAALKTLGLDSGTVGGKIGQMQAAVATLKSALDGGRGSLEAYKQGVYNLSEEIKKQQIKALEGMIKDLDRQFKEGLISTGEYAAGVNSLRREIETLSPSIYAQTPSFAALAEQSARLSGTLSGITSAALNAKSAVDIFGPAVAGLDLSAPIQQVDQLGDECLSLPSKTGPALTQTKGQYDAFSSQVSTIFTDLSRRVTDILFDGDSSWGEKGKAMLDELGKSVTRLFVEPATAAISGFMSGVLKDLLGGKGFGGILDGLREIGSAIGGVFGGGASAAGTAAGGAGSAAGSAGGAGGGATSGLGGLAGGINLVSGVVSAISGVFSAIGTFRLEGTMNAVEESTRYTKILTEQMKEDHWSRFNQLMPKLDDLWTTLMGIHASIATGVWEKLDWITQESRLVVSRLDGLIGLQQVAIAGMDVNFAMLTEAIRADQRPHITINVTGTLDPQDLGEAIYDELQRRGVTK